ncbi:MAG: hypothetical protein Q9164_001785 [Protoblastenia rupestris]
MNAPYAPQDASEISGLIKSLESSTKKGGGGKHSATSKKNTYDIGNSVSVNSWQFKDWDYKRRDLPTYARGLFTYRRRDGTPEIAVRGYDKFFNVGEVHETSWNEVEARTRGPYELSVKENGCIIFLAGLEGDHLLVCSKHSTGARQDADLSHAVAGERWVDRHLNTVGKTRADLARELRRRNVTAVAELCDDHFEEHVLAYEPKDAGLYLHGMNLNLPEFATYSGDLVHQFADEWGFKKAQYLIKDDVASMQEFLTQCAETGSYAGRDTEGFVIRCERREHGTGGGFHNWFFKYKFEEPYLMYRQWRECTKQVIHGKPPRFKKHKRITEEYLLYARRELAKDPALGQAYNHNHGIIAMRDGFLKERGIKGSDIIRQEQEDEESSDAIKSDVLLLPVASIGCGKTTVALALKKLFDWGHVQNDNIVGKQNRPKQFTTQICDSLAVHHVCIGDRNNHQKRERKQIIDDVLSYLPDTKFIALQYVHDPKPKMIPAIRKITQERIFARGDNHQTIQAGSKSRQEIISIMEGFLNRFEPLDPQSEPDDAFEEIIDLDVASSSRKNLETVVSSLHDHYPQLVKKMPDPSDLDNAIEAALNDYKPDVKHDLSFRSNKALKTQPNGSTSNQTQQNGSAQPPKPPKLEYFCIKLPTPAVLSTLTTLFSKLSPEAAKMYHHLQTSRRLQPSFHLTLIHRASISSHPELWQQLSSLHANTVTQASQTPSPTFDPILGKCRVRLEKLVWDDRVMCIVARLLDEGWESVNEVAHVTVGTAREGIKPKESNDLLKKWLGEEGGVMEKDVEGFVEVPGEIRAVMQSAR